ncbi:hypothetical protein B5E77_01540 [Lachnoclostridium sp. An131]|nr:hypothetical protein B5E77_01540 [Lachnoclostridium sp. An131]
MAGQIPGWLQPSFNFLPAAGWRGQFPRQPFSVFFPVSLCRFFLYFFKILFIAKTPSTYYN